MQLLGNDRIQWSGHVVIRFAAGFPHPAENHIPRTLHNARKIPQQVALLIELEDF
jgi:hypothetical protein